MVEKLLSLKSIYDIAHDCLVSNGCSAPHAAAVAETITAAERDGNESHGLFRLPGYVASLQSGKVNGAPKPSLSELAPSVLQVDGDGGFAPFSHKIGHMPLIERARLYGVATLAFINTYHFNALWNEVEPIAREGLAALAFTSFKPAMAPTGGSKPLFGTNPMAFAWPRPGRDPVIFDQASSAMSRGDVMIAAREGRSLPETIGVDCNGRATTDPQAILNGALLPFGGYKGSSIAMMIELLVGALIGEVFSFEAAARDNGDGGPPKGGELIIAIDPSRFGDADGWAIHAESLFDQMLAQDGVRLPSNRRYTNRYQSKKTGVKVDENLIEAIKVLIA